MPRFKREVVCTCSQRRLRFDTGGACNKSMRVMPPFRKGATRFDRKFADVFLVLTWSMYSWFIKIPAIKRWFWSFYHLCNLWYVYSIHCMLLMRCYMRNDTLNRFKSIGYLYTEVPYPTAHWVHHQPQTSLPETRPKRPKRKGSSSNHPFSGANC